MEESISFFNHENEQLSGTLHTPLTPSGAGVVLGHCFTCSQHTRVLSDISHELVKRGISTLRFDFSGNGKSQGNFVDSSYSKHIREMELAVAFLEQRGLTRIGLAGHSMGAAIAVLAASRLNRVISVCAIAGRLTGLDPRVFLTKPQRDELDGTGFVSFFSRGRTLQLAKPFFEDAETYELRETLAKLRQPLMIVHGDRDVIIPPEIAREAAEIRPEKTELVLVEGADHMFSGSTHRSDVSNKVAAWFQRQMMERKGDSDGTA